MENLITDADEKKNITAAISYSFRSWNPGSPSSSSSQSWIFSCMVSVSPAVLNRV
jgi:hypothetical protein